MHRHDDLQRFFTEVLGVQSAVAEADACQVEHGLSAETSQRLHEFLLFLDDMPDGERAVIRRFLRPAARTGKEFDDLPESKTMGWRT